MTYRHPNLNGGATQTATNPDASFINPFSNSAEINGVDSFYFRLGHNIVWSGCSNHDCFYGLTVCVENDQSEEACHTFTQAEIDHHKSGSATEDEKRYVLQHNGQNFVL